MKRKIAEIVIAFAIVAIMSGLYCSHKTKNHVVEAKAEVTQTKTNQQTTLVTGTVKVSVAK